MSLSESGQLHLMPSSYRPFPVAPGSLARLLVHAASHLRLCISAEVCVAHLIGPYEALLEPPPAVPLDKDTRSLVVVDPTVS